MGGNVIQGDARAMDVSRFGRYGVIVADPPWLYHHAAPRGHGELPYPDLSLDDIMAMPVPDLCAPDCVLFLWGTWPKLPEVLEVLHAWGFEYVTGLPWVKMTAGRGINYGIGYWVRGCSEFVFIGRRGNVSPPRMAGYLGLLSPNLHHSRKPQDIHELAETLPGPYLELFGRRPREGWDVFGNEVQLVTAGLPLFAGAI